MEPLLRGQLVDRRQKLETALHSFGPQADLERLLGEVDAALARMSAGTYGLCEACHEPIEADRLMANPLVRLCLGHLTPSQQRALEEDLGLAARIQAGLLPPRDQRFPGWEIAYHYEAAGPVSGDYCDLIPVVDGLVFVLGDVSGKGVAASMLMAHLHAMFRTLAGVGLDLRAMVERASRVFCESTLPSHYATLVCGRISGTGQVEICNAGHLPPLWLRAGGVERIEAQGLPLGLFCNERFAAVPIHLAETDTLLVFSDGLSEARDPAGAEYGLDRLAEKAAALRGLGPAALIRTMLDDVARFRGGAPRDDDCTVLALTRISA